MFVHREDSRRGANAPLQAMVTNGHCGKDASVLLAKFRDTVLLGAETNISRSFSLPIVVGIIRRHLLEEMLIALSKFKSRNQNTEGLVPDVVMCTKLD